MLPRERPDSLMGKVRKKISEIHSDEEMEVCDGDDGDDGHGDGKYIHRNYHMSYVPSGFWSRLIGTLYLLLFYVIVFTS